MMQQLYQPVSTQYICFSNGIPEPPSASDKMNLFDPSTRPTEAIKMQIIQEL